MEQHIGRLLEAFEVVHHINMVKTDNYIENLYLTTDAEHLAIHNRALIQSPERRLKIRKGIQNKRKNKAKARDNEA